MKNHVFIVAAAALLASCTQGPSTTPPLSQTPSVTTARNHARGSWMRPDAKKQSLLYVSSVLTDDVYVYSLSSQKLLGTLTGFNVPYGLCTDKAGDVWIVNDGASQLVEYAHGGTAPIATLNDPNEYPEGCAVDPVTGDLAVTNFYAKSGNGNVVIYAGARGSPQPYADSAIANYRFCGYDSKGNLFVDGANASSKFAFAELPKGSGAFTNIPIHQTIEWPGGVQWDGKYVAVGDTDATTIYRIDAANGTVKDSVPLQGASYVNQFWIVGSAKKKKAHANVAAASQDGNAAGFYKYPAGGSALWTIGVQEPFGVTVSP